MSNRLSQLRIKLDHLGKIARDESGNILWISAISLFPMIGLIGSGVDMSRAYMAKTRLQAACDAGTLAGRKAMGKSGVYDDVAQKKAKRMFDVNFDKATNGASTYTFTTQTSADGQVSGVATAPINTLVMRIFNKPTINIMAECKAELQLTSSDIMFVLDTTGSMSWCTDGSTSCNGGAGSRIVGLRDAVEDFHKTMAAAVTNDTETRIRYSFVPYSSTVNVKNLVADNLLSLSSFVDQADYQTRVARYNTPVWKISNINVISRVNETSTAFANKNDCLDWANNSGNNPSIISGTKPGNVQEKIYSNGTWSNRTRTCVRQVTERTAYYEIGGYEFSDFVYKQRLMNVSAFKNGGVTVSVGTAGTVSKAGDYDPIELPNAPGATGVATRFAAWDGCIEERQTAVDFNMNPVPSGATDLDIVSAPTSEATKWKPLFDDVTYNRATKSPETNGVDRSVASSACPSPMTGFKTVDTTDATTVPDWLHTYLQNLIPQGATYHDLGMIWGARMASQRGINAANVNDTANKGISRHIIFMTDGEMAPTPTTYTAYGIESLDNRIAPEGTSNTTPTSDSQMVLANYHNNRFLAVCERAKAEGYTVWAIGFGTTLTSQLRRCSSDNRAYQANNTDELKQQFRQIATDIADLRLSQ